MRVWCCNFLTDSILVVNSLTLTKLVLTATFSLLVNKYSHIFSHLGLKPALYELFFQYAILLCLSKIFTLRATEAGGDWVPAKICSYDGWSYCVEPPTPPAWSAWRSWLVGGDLLAQDDQADSWLCFVCWRTEAERQVLSESSVLSQVNYIVR